MKATLISLAALVFLSSCRGWVSEAPPVHPNPNMDTQAKYKPFRESDFFADSRAMRPQVAGTIARGQLKEDDHFYVGKIDNKVASTYPASINVDKEFVLSGRRSFNTYCAHCHDHSGHGEGVVGKRLPVKPSSFHTDYLRGMPVGHFFDVISNGIRTMPAHGYLVPEIERWAIVSYIKSLQLSQNANG